MNYSDYRFTLDVQIHQAQVSVPVTFGDSARRLCIGLTDGRKPYVIAEGCRAVFNAKKPDGNFIKNDCIIERNVILYEFTEQTTNSEGIVYCDITLYDADGKVLTSPQFTIVVDKRVVRNEEATPSSDEYTALDNIFIRETARVNAEALRVEAENSRVDAETLRIDAESDRDDAELTRIANENQRVNAESLRADAEIARNLAETARTNAEELRANAESQRMSDFEAGQTFRSGEYERAEAQRQSDFEAAEFGRNESEMQRDGAELNRANAELTRISNETERQNKEAERQSNEVIRQKAEVERGKLYTAAEAERDRLYGVAEAARDSEFNTKETARQTAFTKEQSDRAAAWNTEYASREAQLNTFVGGLGIAQTPGDSESKVMSQKATTEYVKDYVPKVATRNLANLTFENAQISSSDGSFAPITPDRSFYGMSSAASADYIEVEEGKTYTLSWKKNDLLPRIYVHMYDAERGWLGQLNKSTAGITSWTPQLSDGCRYVRVYLYKGDVAWEEILLEEFQFELGDVATPYVLPELISGDVLDIEYAQELGHSEDVGASQKMFTEKISDANATIEGVLDSFNCVKTIAYATGKASRDDGTLGLNISMSTYIGWAVPIKKVNFPTKATGVTVWLISNENRLNVAVDLLDQNLNLIKSLAEEEIELPPYLYYSGEDSGCYLKEHTFNCEFYRSEITTEVAYIRVYIPNTTLESTARLRLGTQKTAQTADEIDVTVTPTYYTLTGVEGFTRDTMVDQATGKIVARPQNIFVRIQRDSTKSDFAYDAYGLPILELDGYTANMNKDNAVTLAYKYGDRKGSCTLKWQGSSSIAYPKKNYTIKFDSKFEAKEGWGEQKKYCLKANYIDFSHSRNICCAKLWGGVVKSRSGVDERLTALVNGGAIDGFPICVVINGEYKGLYTFNIPKDGWMFGMGDGTSEAILCAENASDGRSTFRKEALLDETDWSIEYQSDGFTNDAIRTSFNRLVRACINSDGTDLDTTIAQYLDWESAIDYYAHCLVTLHHDGISKNCLMVTYDGTKWFFSAYDMDSTFGLHWNGSKMLKVNYACSVNYLANNHRVFELIKTYKADELKARYKELVNGALSEETIIETFTNFAGSIPKALLDEEVKIWTTLPSTSVNNVAQIIDFNRRRRAYIDPQIEAL